MTALEASFGLTVGRGDDAFDLEADLRLEAGVLVLFGPSGCGKTLSVAALAGHLRPARGRIVIGGQVVFDETTWVPPRRRRIGYVPQHDALFPFRDVVGNLTFGLPRERRRAGDPEIAALLDELGLKHLCGRRPGQLSGGERQRVALGRALAMKPALLLLDEPFASIDTAGRRALRQIVAESLERHAIPAVFVTHDPEEAARLGDVVALYERGRTRGIRPTAETFTALRLEARIDSRDAEGVRLRDARLVGPSDALPDAGEPVSLPLSAS